MKIRRFEFADAPAVAALWQYWFRNKTRVPVPGLVDLVRRIYLEDPNRDDEITSLVAESDQGGLQGFLGVTATPVVVDGRATMMAGVFPSVVDPTAPTAVASLLLRKFLAGPQVFTVSDGGHAKFERIWETLGGQIAQLQSLYWMKPFRPSRVAASLALRGAGNLLLAPVLNPLADGLDWVARQLAPRRLTAQVPEPVSPTRAASRATSLVEEPLTPGLLAEVAPAIHGKTRLRPVYREEHLSWLFGQMARIRQQGELKAKLLRTRGGEAVGWYVYYLLPGGVSRLFALEMYDRHLDDAVDHLFADAETGGAGALIGRLEPRLRRPLVARHCLVDGGGSLLMVHSRDRSLMDEAALGRLAFSRLQGENWYWWGIISREVP